MLSLFGFGLLAILLAAALFGVAARFLPAGEQIAPPLRDEAPWELPAERALLADDVDTVRLPVALRGYRFAETDLLLDRLAGELRARDEEIARLRGGLPAAEDPAVGDPAVKDLAAEDPAVGDPAVEDLAAGSDPTDDEPTDEEPTDDEPTGPVDEPVAAPRRARRAADDAG